ncbi:hypothetical protein BpHYR1_026592 [Brachionus plicatilis]|uniref:Uncharacterized protein n=1 Tax=Brachionus plicatilis TaxID=10195 RepID=A0A3M7R8L0_BRAPC|nr:hypothetical protein BpHYR1_026592 [Brachionus plicatilis]
MNVINEVPSNSEFFNYKTPKPEVGNKAETIGNQIDFFSLIKNACKEILTKELANSCLSKKKLLML